MTFQRVHQSRSQSPQVSSSRSQFAPRPFPVQKPKRPPTQEKLENHAFNQDKFEATGLQLKEKYGTITPIEQERLGMLQAKMDSFWAQRMERAKAQPNLLEILIRNAQSTQITEPAVPVQPKLTIGQPNDQYEQEADRVAEQVMSMSPPATPNIQSQAEEEQEEVQTKPLLETTITPIVQPQEEVDDEESIQAKCEACKQEEKIQRSSIGIGQTQSNLESRLNASKGGGSPLSDEVRSFMEPRFGTNFEDVRVHTGSEAAQMNRELNAQAFTHKQNVYFGAGKDPGKAALTAHELTHVVQQAGGVQTKLIQNTPNLQQKCSAREKEDAPLSRKADSNIPLIQRTIGDGHDLGSPRFMMDPDLEACYDDEARLTIDGKGKPGTRKVQSGPGVKKVKEALIELGYLEGEAADENYTQKTWDAVKKLKKEQGLRWEDMGDVGPGTMKWLNDKFPSSSTTCPPCPSPEPRPSPCLPCPPDLPIPPQLIIPPGPIKPPGSVTGFCVPFPSKQVALEVHRSVFATVVIFTAKFGSDVQNLWIEYLTNPKSGTKGTLPPRKLFGDQKSRVVNEFREDPETKKQTDRIIKLLAARVRSNPKLMPQLGQSTPLLDFRPTLGDSELLDLPMSFQDPANKIPGLIAGGFGKNSSDAGDDVRNVTGKFIATNLGSFGLQIRASFVFDVFDCVDFCPGNSGSGWALGLTIPMSMLEATPDVPTYDVPFEVAYGLSDDLID